MTLRPWKMMDELDTPFLLVDADFRNSVMRGKFNIIASIIEKIISGEACLSGYTGLEDVIYKTNISNTDIMPLSTMSQTPL